MSADQSNMLPCERLEGLYLKGERFNQEWLVRDKVKRGSDRTGGNFSIGYRVENKDGTVGFLKATDIGFLVASPKMSALEKTVMVMTEQQFERTILGSNYSGDFILRWFGGACLASTFPPRAGLAAS